MSKEVLENQIWELERQLNILQCKDRFDDEDYDLQRNLNRQIAVKKKELEALEYLRHIRKGALTKEAKETLVKTVKETYTVEEIERANVILDVSE